MVYTVLTDVARTIYVYELQYADERLRFVFLAPINVGWMFVLIWSNFSSHTWQPRYEMNERQRNIVDVGLWSKWFILGLTIMCLCGISLGSLDQMSNMNAL